jgi:hypothetical protein
MPRILKLVIAIALVAAWSTERGQLEARGRMVQSGTSTAADTAPITMPRETTLADWDRVPFYDFSSSHFFFTVISMAPLNADGRPAGWSAVGADLNRQQIVFNIRLSTLDDLVTFQHRLANQVTRASVANPTDKVHHGMGIDINREPPPPCCQPGGDDWARSVLTLGYLNMRNQIAAFNGAFQGGQ